MIVDETPLERIECDIARLKGLPNVMLCTVEGIVRLAPRANWTVL